jgi:ATP-binding cassette, subfamily C (CFTR/MRP), member 1
MLVAQYLPLADHIIILDENGKIAEQGTWVDLRAEAGYISKVILKENEEGEGKIRGRAQARDQIQITPEEPDSAMQDITRKTGDVTLYSRP